MSDKGVGMQPVSYTHLCGTPLTVISAGMGHTSERTTRIYLAQLDHNIIDKANRKIIDLQ